MNFWDSIKVKLEELSSLDKDKVFVFGASLHKYTFAPCVNEETIFAYESRFNIKLPSAYREFLLDVGSGGVGPDYGLYDFPNKIHQVAPDKPLKLKRFKGVLEVDENESLRALDGLVRIGTSGNPSCNYLVTSGELAGSVIWYNHDHSGYMGTFDQWYERWIDESIRQIHQLEPLLTIQSGISLKELAAIVARPYKLFSDNTIVRFEDTPGYVLINSNEKVVDVVLKKGLIVVP